MLRQVCLLLAGLGIGGVVSGLVGGLALTPSVVSCIDASALQPALAPWCEEIAQDRALVLLVVPLGTLVAAGGMGALAFRLLRRRPPDDLAAADA